MRLAHLTDPHLTPLPTGWPGGWPSKRWLSWLSWQRRRRHLHRRERLDALVETVRHQNPDAWAVTGDLCQTGTADEIDVATAWLQPLAAAERIIVTPGNHDVFGPGSRARIDADWAKWLHAPEDRVAVRRFGPATLIAVDSAIVTPVASARGELGPTGRARLARALHDATGTISTGRMAPHCPCSARRRPRPRTPRPGCSISSPPTAASRSERAWSARTAPPARKTGSALADARAPVNPGSLEDHREDREEKTARTRRKPLKMHWKSTSTPAWTRNLDRLV